MSKEVLATKAGLYPSQNALTYTITTADAEKFLQTKVNAIVGKMRTDGYPIFKKDGRSVEKYDGPDIEIDLIGLHMSNVFVPFSLILPTSVIIDRKRKRNGEKELSIFDPKGNDGTVNIYYPLASLFGTFMYNDDDKRAFFSPDWRRARKIPHSAASSLKYNATPKLLRINGGKTEIVTCLLDPIRVFYDMLQSDDDKANYHIEIMSIQKQKEGEYSYTVQRVLNKKRKKGGKNNIAADITRRLMGR